MHVSTGTLLKLLLNFEKVFTISVIMAIPLNNEEEEAPPVPEVVAAEAVQERESSESEELAFEESEESFVGQLLKELVGVYGKLSSSGRRTSTPQQRRRRTLASNATRGNDHLSTSASSTPSMLPDLICDHVHSPRPFPSSPDTSKRERQQNNVTVQPRSRRTGRSTQRPTKLFASSSSNHDDLNSELALDIKMTIDFSYQRIGSDLRQVGDTFENLPRPRRRHPAGNQPSNSTQLSLNVELALHLVIPATLLSLVGLAFLRRSSS